jgi:membrane-bound lytic murein transglycosylase D
MYTIKSRLANHIANNIESLIENISKINQQKLVISSFYLLIGYSVLIFPQHAIAENETNVAGVEIEVIDEPVASDLIGDPVQDFLGDLDQSADLSQMSDGDLWARIKDGYAMPDTESQYTTKQENWYASNPDYVKRMVDRSQRYLFHIVEEVQKRGMPTEIALLPMIESAFNPQAYSRSRASGIWQFIPSTGKNYGLKQNWWVDNRRDVTAATNAALDYLEKLHGMFGAWDLALAAYNAGEGTVQRAINRNRKQGLPTDYKSLDLPLETRNYVPKLQAIKNVVTDPERYGLNIAAIPNRPYFTHVSTPKQIDAKLAAQLAEISYEEFTSLNPSFNRPVITATGEKHQLLLPVWAADRFTENLKNYDKPLTSWQTYQAKRGERMDHIANKFGINEGQLRYVNGLNPRSKKLRNAQAMLVPATYSGKPLSDASEIESDSIDVAELENNNTIDQADEAEPKSRQAVIHKVKSGDTLQALALKYDTSAKTITKINRLKSSKLKLGQKLKIKETGIKTANYKSSSRKVLKTAKKTKASANKKTVKRTIKSKKHSSGHIRARSHIRLK